MKGINKKIISCLLLIALIAVPIAGCVGRNLPPVADFTYSPLVPTTADNVIFTDKSTDADGNIVSWVWNFGDGNTSTIQNSDHRYCDDGAYHAWLTVTDDDGASDTHTVTITVSPPPAGIDKDGAIAILVGKIIKPASSYDRISAFMLSQPLQNGDVITSQSGEEYQIDTNTWFIFVDDAPEAFFAHDTRYVFIDAKTGSYDIIDETWPPVINNVSMWDAQNLGRGQLIELYSILDSAVPTEQKKVKAIPVPWQEWRVVEDDGVVIGVIDDIFFDPPEITEPVAIVRDYVVLDEEIELNELTWEGTDYLPWEPIDDATAPYILEVNEHVEYFIPTTEDDRAVLVRYSVAWASTPEVIECHFINEAILESRSPQVIVGWLSNFDVHNDYHEPIDNFELEFYGNIVPGDVLYVYDPPGPPTLTAGWLGPTWYGGWGAPPQITPILGGIEVKWKEPTHPAQPCEWIHFGVALNPNTVFLTGVKAYLTQLVLAPSQAPSGDYGDAPDGYDAYYGVPGRFPTLFNTTNSKFTRPGGHTLNVGEETLGLNVSAEVDAIDPNDPDGVPNLVDADSDERIYVIVEGKKAKLAFTVTVSPNAPDVTRYANALIDFDQSGNWSAGAYGTEWVVVNLAVDVAPGSSETVITSWFSWGNKAVLPSPVWMRLSLTREKVSQSLFANVGGWDGSGQFEYGEIEDYFAFLMDNPPLPEFVRWPPPPKKPPGGDGKDGKNGGQPPGSPEGPCGYDINFYVIIINCGDSAKHLGQGTPYMRASAERMGDVAAEQDYTSMGNLGPNKAGDSKTSLGNIGKAFGKLANSVNCGDHVLIYICGHGYKSGGISIADSSGNEDEVMKPKNLEDFLKKIPPCPDEDCDTPKCCCHVSVIIESCFAGNFNVPGVTGSGRAVTGTSSDKEAWLTYPGGGVYTQGFDKDLRNPNADTSIPPDGVDPVEAHESATKAVDDYHKNRKTTQKPWNDNQWCECKCPCEPGIDGDKWVWDEIFGMWVNGIEALPGQPVRFRLEIENDGECRDIVDLEMIDFLPGCLEYADEAIIFYNGVEYGPRPPDEINQGEFGLQLVWDLEEIGALAPGESIAIEYDAIAEYPGANVNVLFSSAHCAYDYSVIVSDEDTATVMVVPPEIPPEEVLYAYLHVYWECDWYECECVSCTLTIDIEGEDLTGGDYLVTNVMLIVNGGVWHNSGLISTALYQKSIDTQVGCGEPFNVEVIVTNEIGLTATATKTVTTPTICPP